MSPDQRHALTAEALSRLTCSAERLLDLDPSTPIPARLQRLDELVEATVIARRVVNGTRRGGPV